MRQDDTEHTSLLAKSLRTAALVSAVGAVSYAGDWVTAPVIKSRDIGLRIDNGVLTDAHVKPGRQMDHYIPGVHYDVMPGHQLSTIIMGDKGDHKGGLIVRSKEGTQIMGNYKMLYHLDHEDPNVGHIYTRLRIDGDVDENDKKIDPIVNSYGQSAIAPVYSKVSAPDINTNITEIRKELRNAAQKILDDEKYTYIKVDDIIPDGTGLTPEANRDLEAIVGEKRKVMLYDAQEATARKAEEVSKKQSDVTLENIKKFHENGMSWSESLSAYQLQLMRDNGKIGTPGVLSPAGGTVIVPAVK